MKCNNAQKWQVAFLIIATISFFISKFNVFSEDINSALVSFSAFIVVLTIVKSVCGKCKKY